MMAEPATTRLRESWPVKALLAPNRIPPSDVLEPARAAVARAEWNSILAGLIILLLAGSALQSNRRRIDAGEEGR
jgi:hypothetical protein